MLYRSNFQRKKIKLEPVSQPELVRSGRKPIVQLTTILRFYEVQKNAKDSISYEDQEELAHINITFQATYRNAGKAPKEFWELYTFHTAPHDLWQLIRQYLYSLLESMNIKNCELPLEFDDLMQYQYETIQDILSDDIEKKIIDNM